MVLCVVLERGWRVADAVGAMQRWLRGPGPLPWLPPRRPVGTIAVASVPIDGSRSELEAAVRTWASDVWSAWAPAQETVRRWVDAGRPG
jgi:hypothetical protein